MTLNDLIAQLSEQKIIVTTVSSYYHIDGKLKPATIDLTNEYDSYDVNCHIDGNGIHADITCNED